MLHLFTSLLAASHVLAVPSIALGVIERSEAAAINRGGEIGTVAITPHGTPFAPFYTISVSVREQEFDLLLDTGSSDLWVFGPQIPKDQSHNHTVYMPSTDAHLLNKTWDVTYKVANASGIVYRDSVSVGGLTARQQDVETATEVPDLFVMEDMDGVIGFAPELDNGCSPTVCQTFFRNIEAEGNLPERLFTVSLKQNTSGSLDMGYIDASKYTGDIVWKDVHKVSFSIPSANGTEEMLHIYDAWNVTIDGILINSTPIKESFTAIPDSGTGAIVLSPALAAAFWSQVPGASLAPGLGGLYAYPCNETLPSFGLIIGGQDFTVSLDPINIPDDDFPGACTAFIAAAPDTGEFTTALLGDQFLYSVFAIYDQGHKRVGFAKQA